MKKIVIPFCLFLVAFLIQNCAQKATPTGGKKDIVGPMLVSSNPKNKSLNITQKEIELVFDEYIKLDNLQQQLIITPKIEGTYKSKINKKTLVLKFEKEFRANTTYVLNFRNGIKDITESNVAQNMKYVLSTGDKIDSLKVQGKVILAETNEPILNATVGLFVKTDTLNILKEIPYYFTQTDSMGNFLIENIKSNQYVLAGFLDANNNNIINISSEKLSVYKDTIQLKTDVTGINLKLVKQDKLPLKIVTSRTTTNKAFIELNKRPEKIKVFFENTPLKFPIAIKEKEITIYKNQVFDDTLKVRIEAVDSLGKNYDFKQKLIFKKPTKKQEIINEPFVAKAENLGSIEPTSNFVLQFNKPVIFKDYSKIKIQLDSLNTIKVDSSIFNWDENKTKLTIKNITKYKDECTIKLLKGAFISVENDSSKTENFNFKFIDEEGSGILSGKIKDFAGNEIVELLNEKYEVQKFEKYKNTFSFKYILPGKYYLRKFNDINKNGKWDSGDFENKVVPENIQFFTGKIIIKSNFELSGYDF